MHNHCITIKDIARKLNLSISTVSRAFRDAYDISPETREKVLSMAAQLNYKPNFNAIGLVKNQTHNIAVMLPSITNYYFSTVITGIQEVAYRKGYNIIFYVTNDSPERELSIIENLSLTSIDGLLVCTTLTAAHSGHFRKIMDNGTPVVFFDRAAPGVKTSKVMQDDYNGAFEAVRHLVDSGYEKIAHISGRKTLAITQNRTRGYLDALKKFNLPICEEWITQSGFSQEDGEKDVYDLLLCSNRPDAIFAINDRKAIGAMLSLKKLDIKIGEEMGVIGFTNDPVSSIISPGLTTIAVPALEVGSNSCELLLKHISKKHFEPQELILPGKLIIRESTLRNGKKSEVPRSAGGSKVLVPLGKRPEIS